jgi:hypothetical protein
MTNVLHLSDTPLSGSPIRITKLLNKYSSRYKARHIVWKPIVAARSFEVDAVAQEMQPDQIRGLFKWADIIHYHNRWKRQQIFSYADIEPPQKKSVIQVHSPKLSEDFSQEIESKIPIAVIAQYHTRQWPTATYLVPNVVDIMDPVYMPMEGKPDRPLPVVSYAPSNTNMTGWNDKGYGIIMPHLKRMKFDNKIILQLIIEKPHDVAMKLKRGADISIDEIATGSYHLSSLEYLSMGVPCFCLIDHLTARAVRDVTGCEELPWIIANKDSFLPTLQGIMHERSWAELGKQARAWMEKYWNPQFLLKSYEDMYDDL